MKPLTEGPLPARKQGLTIRTLDDEVLVYDPETTRASCLNSFAAEVLMRCDGERTPAEIAHDLPFETVDDRLVILALGDLQKARLLEPHAAVDIAAIIGSSRRAFLKRMGIGTAVAVPVVTGLRMPPASAAATGDTCFGDDDCSFGLVCRQQSTGNPCVNPEAGKECTCQPP